MKKIYFFLAILLVAGFSACDEIGLDVAPPQSNPQEDPQVIDGFTIVVGDDFKAALVLTGEEQEFQVVKATATPPLAEGATIVFRTEISDTKDFVNVVELITTSADNASTVLSSDLNAAVQKLFNTKAPVTHTIYTRNYFSILEGTSASQMPKPADFGPFSVTAFSNVKIEPAYYLIGNQNGWNINDLDAYKFSRSDLDVYDDPIFTITVLMPENCYFKIVPQSSKDKEGDARWGGLLGNPVDGNTDLEGILIVDGDAMRIVEEGWVKITLNMMESTYTIELLGNALQQLYVAGNHQGWNPATAPIVFSPNLDWKFDGYVYMTAGNTFKLTAQPNWDGPNYGDGGEGKLSDSGGDLSVPETGFYRFTVDLNNYTYTATTTEWGLIGSATGSWDVSTPMELNSATGEWTVTTTLTEGALKFRANNAWDINIGGDMNNLTYNGADIPIASAGTYLITLKLGDASAYTCTVVKQ
ncbi:MAG: DUF5115 domain-containing protein [Dysgonamonadaceae bacterium]|jgi:hypothetical protein|nr:DUF5115 domain-containing protein [Dysgonamonadaceae bacterium]